MTSAPRFVGSLRQLGLGLEVLEELFQQAPFGVYVDHPVDGCVYANPALLEQFGVSWEEFKGFEWARFVLEEDTERIREAIATYQAKLEPVRITYRVRTPAGEERWINANARAIRSETGDHVGSIALVENVTDERVLRDKVAGTQKLEAVGRLAARIAHDFNNWLTVMMASSELLSDSIKDGDGKESLASLDAAIEQSVQITRQLLSLTRHRMGSAMVSCLDDELRSLQPLVERSLGEGVVIEWILGAPAAHVGLDSGQIGQVVLNLATNGHDAMEGYGELIVRSYVTGEVVKLEVEDHGEGMDEATMRSSFDAFFTTKSDGRGTGLGLTTVRDVVEVVGGTVEVRSTVGEGTTFVVTLPRVHEEYVLPAVRKPAAPTRHDEVVLLVEDRDDLRQSMAYALALGGYRIRSARSLKEARENLEPPPDVLVTDVMLTDGNGVDLVGQLRAEKPELPVVIISGYAGESTIGLEADSERTAFLPKPFRPRDLLCVLQDLLSARQAGSRSEG